MHFSHPARGIPAWALALAGILLMPSSAAGGQLRAARIDVTFSAARHCDVAAAFTVEVDGRTDIEHRLQVPEAAAVTLRGTEGGARVARPPAVIGRTRALAVTLDSPGTHIYTLRYQVIQPDTDAFRCPIWLPTTPTDGRSMEIAIGVAIPDGAEAGGGSLPAFVWDGRQGQARVGHVPAFIRAPFRAAGESAGAGPVNVTRLMDLVAITVLACGTALFAWRRRRR